MNEIGELLRVTREESGVSLEEASTDLKIKTLILENIEEGNMGCFKDIFLLKDYIYDYAKYLGLNPDKVIDDFNEYLFEYTSKIPVEEIEKEIQKQKKDEAKVDKIASPYTLEKSRHTKLEYILYVILAVLVLLLILWSVKQITINNAVTDMISYIR